MLTYLTRPYWSPLIVSQPDEDGLDCEPGVMSVSIADSADSTDVVNSQQFQDTNKLLAGR